MFSSRLGARVRRNIVAPCAAALGLGLVAASPATAQVLLNGNFENNPQMGHPLVVAPNFVDPQHTWQVVSGSVNAGTAPAATPCQVAGAHCIDLNGEEPGRIEQIITGTTRGQRCTVSFFMSRHAQLAGTSATLRAYVDHAPSTPPMFVHNLAGVSDTNGRWEAKSFNFIANFPTTVLGFESALAGAAGPQIDNVELRCEPPVVTPPPPVAIDPCCPPWNKELLKDMLSYKGSGAIADPYTLKFQMTSSGATTAFNHQMQAYIDYLHSIPPFAFNQITIDWTLHNQGNAAVPASVLSAPLSGSFSTTTWTSPGSGNPTVAPVGFFNAYPMNVGTWYAVHTVIHLKKDQTFFPEKCANIALYVRIQVMSALAPAASGGRGGAMLEFSDGQKTIKSVPIQ